MNVRETCVAIEADLAALDMPLHEFLGRVRVQRITWWRWREKDQQPLAATWERVELAAKDIRKRARARRRRAAA